MKFIIIYDTDTSNQYNWGFLNKVPLVPAGKVPLCLKTDLFVTLKYGGVTWRRYGNISKHVGKCLLGECALFLPLLVGMGKPTVPFALFTIVSDDLGCCGNVSEKVSIQSPGIQFAVICRLLSDVRLKCLGLADLF